MMTEQCLVWLRRAPALTAKNDLLLLDETELSVNQRFATETLRARHACAHALLRSALGQELKCEPSSLSFEPGRNDRPRLVGNSGEFDFNLSHSGAYVACAVVTTGRVGIDVEAINRKMDYTRVLSHVTSPAERAWLESKNPDSARRAFFRLWVLKEAYAKARGDGLNLPFADITLMPAEGGFIQDFEAIGDTSENWMFKLHDVNQDAALAVAIKAQNTERRYDIEIMEGGDYLS